MSDEDAKAKERKVHIALDTKNSPPPEPIDNLPFRRKLEEVLAAPPPEPKRASPFPQTKATKQTSDKKESEGQQ